MKIKIEIKHFITGAILFEFEKENNTLRDTIVEANLCEADLYGADLRGADLCGANLREADLYGVDLRGADLCGANLRGANLRGADLCGADLRGANLRGANLYGANLYGANLRGADLCEANLCEANLCEADLYGADLYGADLAKLPITYINSCSRDMLFIFQCLKKELPFLREKLIKGEVDGTQYEGDCACLVGTLGNADGGVDKVCEMIPYYDKGTHNPGEAWFLNIHKGDTPENNQFAKHALFLIDSVLGKSEK